MRLRRPSRYSPHTRFVAPEGAPQKAQKAEVARVPATQFGTPLTRFVAPEGAPPKAQKAEVACVPAA
eukprot:6959284-Pyramimonas_sp.AAC.1